MQSAPSLHPRGLRAYLHASAQENGWPTEPLLTTSMGICGSLGAHWVWLCTLRSGIASGGIGGGGGGGGSVVGNAVAWVTAVLCAASCHTPGGTPLGPCCGHVAIRLSFGIASATNLELSGALRGARAIGDGVLDGVRLTMPHGARLGGNSSAGESPEAWPASACPLGVWTVSCCDSLLCPSCAQPPRNLGEGEHDGVRSVARKGASSRGVCKDSSKQRTALLQYESIWPRLDVLWEGARQADCKARKAI